MPDKFNFTQAAIAAVVCPADKDRIYCYDLRSPGLALCITRTGQRTFYVYRRVKGRPERIRLDGYPPMTIEQARRKAAEINGDIARGLDPQQIKRQSREEPNLGELFDHYLETHSKPHKKSWTDDERIFKFHLQSWRSRRLSTIQQVDVQTHHSRIGMKNGHYSANRMLSLLRTVLSHAGELGFKGANPAINIKRFRETSRDRFLQADELPRFFQAIADELNETLRDFFLISLLTGARRRNVLTMRWEQINLTRAEWRIPETKNGTPVTLHLSDPAIGILQARPQVEKIPWVFPGRGGPGHITEPKHAWKRVLTRAGLKDLRIHDLRRTLASWQASGGASLSVIGKSLGHSSPTATAVYARLNLDSVRESVNSATAKMIRASERIEVVTPVTIKESEGTK